MGMDEKGEEPLMKKKAATSFDFEKVDRKNLILLFVIGLVSRLYAFSQIYMISLDGVFPYIPMAKLFYHGEYLQALRQPELPLYPFLISLLNHITGNFELSGQLLSIIFSLAALFPLYFIGKSLFGPRAAFWTTILYLVNPLMFNCSVDVLKEGLLVFLFLSSVYCSLRFLQEAKGRWLIWTVAFSAVGALVRPVSLVVLVVLGAWLAYRVLSGKVRESRLTYYSYLWVLAVAFGLILIVIVPGLLGWEFWVSKKAYTLVVDIFNRWFVHDWPGPSQLGEGFLAIVKRFIEKAYPLPLLLAFFGIGWRVKVKEFNAEEKYLTSLMVVLVVILFPNLYASGRYLLPAVFLLYLWAGFTFVKVSALIERRSARYPRLTIGILATILLVTILPTTLKPQRLDKIGYKEAGLWLRERTLTPPVILTDDPRVAYYAGGEYVLIPPASTPQGIMKEGEKEKANYLVIEGNGTEIHDAFAPFEKKGTLELVLCQPHGWKGKIVYVYKMKK
jgi:hypothetical protein